MTFRRLFMVLLLLAAACDRAAHATDRSGAVRPGSVGGDSAPRGDSSYRLRPGYVIDSARPIDEELRQFRSGLPVVTRLEGGAHSRDSLVARFFRAVATADTQAIRGMVLDRVEFAWLVYPESRFARPPYEQPPGLMWMMLQRESGTGISRLFRNWHAGHPWTALAYRCDAVPEREGRNLLWGGCTARVVRARGDTTWLRLFGRVLERDGQFKFVTYGNAF